MENQITDFFYPAGRGWKIDLPHILRMHGKWIAKIMANIPCPTNTRLGIV